MVSNTLKTELKQLALAGIYWVWLLGNSYIVVLIEASYEMYEYTGQTRPWRAQAFGFPYLYLVWLIAIVYGLRFLERNQITSYFNWVLIGWCIYVVGGVITSYILHFLN